MGASFETGGNLLAQPRHRTRELIGCARASPSQKGMVRRQPLRIGDPYLPDFYPQDTPGAVAELKDVAGQTLDSEVLVQGADKCAFRLDNDVSPRCRVWRRHSQSGEPRSLRGRKRRLTAS